jgi:hypothetical protein
MDGRRRQRQRDVGAHPLDAADREQTFADSHAAEIHGPRLDDHQPYPNFR